jgi:opacity protein-like surface antigen
MKNLVSSLCLAVVLIGSVTAVDWTSFGGDIRSGDILVNGGFTLGSFYPDMPLSDISILGGGSGAVDFALPVAALTMGGELGFLGSTVKFSNGPALNISLGVIPIMARIGYHPDLFGIDRLDTYVLAKVGLGIGFWTGGNVPNIITNPIGAAFGLNTGAHYFLTDIFGVFLEGSYEYYFLSYAVDYSLGKNDMAAYANKFLNMGISFKF